MKISPIALDPEAERENITKGAGAGSTVTIIISTVIRSITGGPLLGLRPIKESSPLSEQLGMHSTFRGTVMEHRNQTIKKRWIRSALIKKRSGNSNDWSRSETDPRSLMSSRYSPLLPVKTR